MHFEIVRSLLHLGFVLAMLAGASACRESEQVERPPATRLDEQTTGSSVAASPPIAGSETGSVAIPEPVEEPPPEPSSTTVEAPIEPEIPEASEQPEPKPASKSGVREGGICRRGTRHDLDGVKTKSVTRKCQAGLQCCYPCGAAGCDWICATRAQCDSWRTLP